MDKYIKSINQSGMRDKNYDVSIFIINNEREYVESMEYDKNDDSDCMFVYVTNCTLDQDYCNNNSMLLYKNWRDIIFTTLDRISDLSKKTYTGNTTCGKEYVRWQNYRAKIPFNHTYRSSEKTKDTRQSWTRFLSDTYLDGYMSCQNIMSNATLLASYLNMSKEALIPAIMLAWHTAIQMDGRTLHAYLPAIGQWIYIEKNLKDINTAMNMIDGQRIPVDTNYPANGYYELNGDWWSSTEHDDGFVYSMGNGPFLMEKQMDLPVLPLFQNPSI